MNAPKEAAKDKGGPEAKKGADKRDDAGPAKGSKPGAKDARPDAKGPAPKDAPRRGDSRPPAKVAPPDAQGARKGPRDAAIDVPPAKRDTDSRDKRAPEKARDADRDAGKTPREDARDKAKDAPEAARDRRDADRPQARREGRQQRRDFRAEDVRPADIGLWFNASDQGLVISDVASSGAIAKVGFREGDRIVSVNGQRIVGEADFVRYLFAPDIRDQRVQVIVIRDGREEIVYVQPVVLIQEYTIVDVDPLEEFGIVLDDRYTDRLIVWKVISRSPAFYAGIRAGDVITTVDGRQVVAVNDLVQILSQARADEVTVGVQRSQASRQLRVDVSKLR